MKICKSIKKYGSMIVVFGVSIILLAIAQCIGNDTSGLLEIFAVLIPAIGFFAQMIESRGVVQSQFIIDLHNEFSNGYGTKLYTKCWSQYANQKDSINEKDNKKENEGENNKDNNVNSDEVSKDNGRGNDVDDVTEKDIINYLTFFESIYVVYKEGNLTIEKIDELFGRRFFVVINNKEIQKQELLVKDSYMYYMNIYRLYVDWYKYRVENGLSIFCDREGFCNYAFEVKKLLMEDRMKIINCDLKKKEKYIEKLIKIF